MQKQFSIYRNHICYNKIKKFICVFLNSSNTIFPWNSKKNFGTYGAVTRRKQKQREKFYEEKYRHNPNNIPKYSKVKKGSRGGWINNPLKEVTKNSGSNFMYEDKIKEELKSEENECIKNLIKVRKELMSKEYFDDNVINNSKIFNSNNSSMNKNKENKFSNLNFFSICEDFIEKKKEIIHKIENPQYFVDKHINSLVNEYNNINTLHENYNVNSYPKTPEFLKDLNKKKKYIPNQISVKNFEDEEKKGNINEIHTCDNEGKTNKLCNSINNIFKYDSMNTNNNISYNDLKKNDNISKNIVINKYDTSNNVKKEKNRNELDDFIKVKNEDSNFLGEKIENKKSENSLKDLYIEDFLNYTDENDLDISCLDVFTALSTVDRNRILGTFFSSMNASFILYNNCIIPSKFEEGTINEYFNTRNNCSLFDKSYQLIIKLRGNDCFYICNQFISSDLNDMKNYDTCYSCILDNKSFIIDTCYVLKCENEVILVTSGYYKRGLYEFLSDYILFCKDSGMDVNIEVDMNKRVLSLQGPLSNIVFNDILEYYAWKNKDKNVRYLKNIIKKNYENDIYFKDEESDFFKIPYMSFKKLNMIKKNNQMKEERKNNENDKFHMYEILCIRVGDTGEDGYEFIVDNSISDVFSQLFLNHIKVKLAGAYALDILRMESGIPQYGIDIFKNTTPITASLSWTLKYKKIKERSIFGFQNLLKEYSMKSKILRIGLICNELIFKTCKILSYPYKKPIGYVTSCTWSPIYKKRIAQGYIKREFAKNNEKVLISIPTDIPQEFSKKKKYKILRSRSAHKFTLAQVCALPFVEHKY
ncbi:aminomethyltransferase, putative [Plasmodium gallinaceum]|uniref:Aminomethyltransferase, putative n=1 Tax=Plasmodium gallinaceum TaxID=5849 RepID=A0A1J1GRT8_PLAGA|nr:aminomethyltransferase, putative [Plasmodium gallinaceum]CRG95146.1 aminomethyltransferase, putative [Plasmodium gallinaceum]